MTGDLSPSSAAETGLRDGALRADVILKRIADGSITINERALIESFNLAGERLFGYTAAQVIRQNVSRLMPNPYQAEHDGCVKRYLT